MKKKEDLSRYTIDESGTAPAMREQQSPEKAEPQPEPQAKAGKKKDNTSERVEDKVDLNEIPLESRNRRLYIFGVVVTVLVAVTTVALFYFRVNLTGSEVAEVGREETIVEEVSEEPQSSSEPTAVAPLDRKDISLEVLNGSGIAGEAGRVALIFEELGYEILEVGNAPEQEESELFVSSGITGKEEVLVQDVEKELGLSSSSELADSTASARIILGTGGE